MGKINWSLNISTKQNEPTIKERIYSNDPLAILNLSKAINSLLDISTKYNPPLILCIGTDRSTGDSLGPLTGEHLTPLLRKFNVEVIGTIDTPLHASNLEKRLIELEYKILTSPVIAIDACLGHSKNVGSILVENAPIKPGAGVHKNLPLIGDISISGIVNVSGFMEFQVLQNTRLSVVLHMSRIIANGIYLSIKNHMEKTKQIL